jgi:hypothetical protein
MVVSSQRLAPSALIPVTHCAGEENKPQKNNKCYVLHFKCYGWHSQEPSAAVDRALLCVSTFEIVFPRSVHK